MGSSPTMSARREPERSSDCILIFLIITKRAAGAIDCPMLRSSPSLAGRSVDGATLPLPSRPPPPLPPPSPPPPSLPPIPPLPSRAVHRVHGTHHQGRHRKPSPEARKRRKGQSSLCLSHSTLCDTPQRQTVFNSAALQGDQTRRVTQHAAKGSLETYLHHDLEAIKAAVNLIPRLPR